VGEVLNWIWALLAVGALMHWLCHSLGRDRSPPFISF
jgi:hypothetical protein